jgi:hypothetical protein
MISGWKRATVALGVDTRLGIATVLSECQSFLCDTLFSYLILITCITFLMNMLRLTR